MSRFYLLMISSTFLLSCYSVQVRYLGSSLTPTRKVDVYVDASAILRPYTVIGKGYADQDVYNRASLERMQDYAIEKAKEKGADAVLFQEIYLLNDGSIAGSSSKTDSIRRVSLAQGSVALSPVVTTRRDILFLKYNQ